MATDIAPLGHWLWDELHVSVLLEELEHRALPGPNVALDGHHEGSVVSVLLHALGRTDRRGGSTRQVKGHRHWFLGSVSKMRKFVQVPHYAEEILHFVSNFEDYSLKL